MGHPSEDILIIFVELLFSSSNNLKQSKDSVIWAQIGIICFKYKAIMIYIRVKVSSGSYLRAQINVPATFLSVRPLKKITGHAVRWLKIVILGPVQSLV